MLYTDNAQIKKEFKKLAIDEDITLSSIANEMGLTRQRFDTKLNAKNLTFSEVSQWLNVLGYELHYEFVKKDQ